MAQGSKRPQANDDADAKAAKQPRLLRPPHAGSKVPRKLLSAPKRKPKGGVEVKRYTTASSALPAAQVWTGAAESPSKPVSGDKSGAALKGLSPANSEASTLVATPGTGSSGSSSSTLVQINRAGAGALFSPGSPTLRPFGAGSFFGTGFSPSLTPTRKTVLVDSAQKQDNEPGDDDALPGPPLLDRPPSAEPESDSEYGDGDGTEVEFGEEDEKDAGVVLKAKALATRAFTTVYTNVGWLLGYREQTLLEAVRLDAPPQEPHCTECRYVKKKPLDLCPAPTFRCGDCQSGEWCLNCAADVHRYNPLHNIERFENRIWNPVRRKADIGIEIQLMHAPGDICRTYGFKVIEDFQIIHHNGVHRMRVLPCACQLSAGVDTYAQLMRSKLWPATNENPQTTTTHQCLDQFSRLSLLGRLSGYDYYRAVHAASDAASILGLPSLRKPFMHCVRQFRHIFQFKRAGRAHEDGGIEGTPEGALAIQCPACPREGDNIPVDWRAHRFPWLFRMFVCTDANFRLSNRLTHSTDKTDPTFNDGRGYMVRTSDFDDFLKSVEGNEDHVEPPSDCNRFNAIALVNRKGGKGMRTTGIAGCFCARHEFIFPLGLAPLYKGERFTVMDYITARVHGWINVDDVVYSYDIACQWHKKLQRRMRGISPRFAGLYDGAVRMLAKVWYFVVPKMHIEGHNEHCNGRYNFSYTRWAGQTDGEGCERVWAGANPAATSMREMGPGSMKDTMDDLSGSWNFQKLCNLPRLLVGRRSNAIKNASEHSNIFTSLTKAIDMEKPAKITQKMGDVKAFEANKNRYTSKKCPYDPPKADLTVTEIQRQIDTGGAIAISGMSGAEAEGEDAEMLQACIMQGLKIEGDRAHAKAGVLDAPIDDDSNSTTGSRIAQAVLAFRELQERTMPSVMAVRSGEKRHPTLEKAQKIKLYLPSELGETERGTIASAARMEAAFRWVYMRSSLSELRRTLRLLTCINKFKSAWVRGQSANQRARGAQESLKILVNSAASDYRRHRQAYKTLVSNGNSDGVQEWEKRLPELGPEDVRPLGDRLVVQMAKLSAEKARKFIEEQSLKGSSDIPKTGGQTDHKVPWIWFNQTESADFEINDDIISEWLRCRARSQRWIEEVLMLHREMASVLQHLENQALVWEKRAAYSKEGLVFGHENLAQSVKNALTRTYINDKVVHQGLESYAYKQAHIRREQRRRAEALFKGPIEAAEVFMKTHSVEGWELSATTPERALEDEPDWVIPHELAPVDAAVKLTSLERDVD